MFLKGLQPPSKNRWSYVSMNKGLVAVLGIAVLTLTKRNRYRISPCLLRYSSKSSSR